MNIGIDVERKHRGLGCSSVSSKTAKWGRKPVDGGTLGSVFGEGIFNDVLTRHLRYDGWQAS